MPEDRTHDLPHGIRLHCRVSGTPGQPLLLFLHGFPEGAFIWDDLLDRLSQPEEGGFRCVAPDLRGYGSSSQPPGREAYRAGALVEDLAALIAAESPHDPAAAVIAHDWGGALAWSLANRHPERLRRLMVLNAPHAGTFWRELQHNPVQQAASQYMWFLRRPDAPDLLAADGYRRLWDFFRDRQGALPAWLTPALQAHYRQQWGQGLAGPCHFYGASPLLPPPEGRLHEPVPAFTGLPDALLRVDLPTLVLWGLDDVALQPALLNGLEHWVPQLQVQRLKGCSHWLLHERPERVCDELQRFVQTESLVLAD